jgi:hypothetical protein
MGKYEDKDMTVKIVTDGGLSWTGVPSVELLTELIILATRAPEKSFDNAVDAWDLSRQVAALMPRADVAAAVKGAK